MIEVIAELFLAGVILRDGTIDGAAAARSPRVVPDDRTFAYVLHAGAGPARSASRRTTCGRSSSRRPPSTRASACSWTTRRSRRFDARAARGRVRQPHRPRVRARARPDPAVRPGDRTQCRQRGRKRRGPRAALASRPRRDRGRRRGRSSRSRPRSSPRSRRTSCGAMGFPDSDDAAPRRSGRSEPKARDPRRRPHDRTATRSHGRPERTAGGAARDAHRGVAVPHPHAEAVRGGERGGPRDHRAQRRRDPRGGRRDRARLPRRVGAVRGRGRRRRRRAGAVPAWHVPHRSCRRPRRPCTRSTPATRRTTCRSVATRPCSRPTTGRRSSTTSTPAGATPRSPTSRTS